MPLLSFVKTGGAEALGELSRLGIDGVALTCDITDRNTIDKLVNQASQLGTGAAVVHAAGVSLSMGPL